MFEVGGWGWSFFGGSDVWGFGVCGFESVDFGVDILA